MNIRASLSHGALALPQYGALLLAYHYVPAHWFLALLCSLFWLTRELAQSFRPSAPLAVNITPQFAFDYGIPTVVAFLIALAVELL